MPVPVKVKNRLVTGMQRDIERARTLFDRIVVNGRRQTGPDASTPLMQPDRRDAAQFIFFELAAKFEGFCREGFLIELRSNRNVKPKKAEDLIKKLANSAFGWGSPKTLRERALLLFGPTGFFARLIEIVGNTTYDRLCHAHIIRNRIAHTNTDDYRKLLNQFNVPQKQRRGMSPGRLLLDYPSSANANNRWFHRLLVSYEDLVNHFDTDLAL